MFALTAALALAVLPFTAQTSEHGCQCTSRCSTSFDSRDAAWCYVSKKQCSSARLAPIRSVLGRGRYTDTCQPQPNPMEQMREPMLRKVADGLPADKRPAFDKLMAEKMGVA